MIKYSQKIVKGTQIGPRINSDLKQALPRIATRKS